MTPKALYERLKSLVDREREFLVVKNLTVAANSLGETSRNGGTLFSVTLNQGFGIPTECCAKYAKYRERLTAAQRRLLESVPFVTLAAKTHGLKAIAFVMGLVKNGVRLECQVVAHDRDLHSDHRRVLHDFTNWTRADRLLLARYEKARRAFFLGGKEAKWQP